MGWADGAIEALRAGKTVCIKPHGNSMLPRIQSGQEVTVRPPNLQTLRAGDVVLVRVKGNVYLHLIKRRTTHEFQIGNNRGGINGWVDETHIYGKADV